MAKLQVRQRLAVTFLAVALVTAFASTAAADTIYLKNGRTIYSESVRVEGDLVFFIQFGGEVSLPMALVEKIVEDENTGPEGTQAPPQTAEPDPDAETVEPEEEETPAEETREYWQDRVRAIADEREQVELQIEDLKRAERAFLFSHRSTADTRRQIEDAEVRLTELDTELSDLQTEARRLGIPAGWLRLDPRRVGGGS